MKWIKDTAEKLHEIFLEIIIAPSFTKEAIDVLTSKKNIRLLTIPFDATSENLKVSLTSVEGGLLVQDRDQYTLEDATIYSSNRPKTNR